MFDTIDGTTASIQDYITCYVYQSPATAGVSLGEPTYDAALRYQYLASEFRIIADTVYFEKRCTHAKRHVAKLAW